MNAGKKQLNLTEQKKISAKTFTGGLNRSIGFQGTYTTKGKKCGESVYLQLDGSYGKNMVPSILFTDEILKKLNKRK